MKKHVKVYCDHFGYGEQSYMPCEICGVRLNDCHHIHGRGPGKDVIENLMGLCRECHNLAHAEKISKEDLQKIHNFFLENHSE